MKLSDNYIKLILTLTSERLAGTHSPVRGDRDQEPRYSIDPAQLSEFTSHPSLISNPKKSRLKAQPERGDREDHEDREVNTFLRKEVLFLDPVRTNYKCEFISH